MGIADISQPTPLARIEQGAGVVRGDSPQTITSKKMVAEVQSAPPVRTAAEQNTEPPKSAPMSATEQQNLMSTFSTGMDQLQRMMRKGPVTFTEPLQSAETYKVMPVLPKVGLEKPVPISPHAPIESQKPSGGGVRETVPPMPTARYEPIPTEVRPPVQFSTPQDIRPQLPYPPRSLFQDQITPPVPNRVPPPGLRQPGNENMAPQRQPNTDASPGNRNSGQMFAAPADSIELNRLMNSAVHQARDSQRPIQLPSGALFIRSKASIDADGSPRAREIDPAGKTRTSLRYEGRSMNAETVNYIVVPTSIYNRLAGDVAMVRNRTTGQVKGAIVADGGPSWGEISIHLAKDIGVPSDPVGGGTENPNIDYMVFPGTRASAGRPPWTNQEAHAIAVQRMRQIYGAQPGLQPPKI